jgi:HAD superfamily hydrolase (TIGR01509 family)
LALAGQYLDDVHRVPLADEHAERAVWLRYYGIVLDALKLPDDPADLPEAITSAWEQQPGVEPCPWTRPVLAELDRRGVPVVVLSDAWPSLRRQYRNLGLARYVQAIVISGEEGVTKPDPRAFGKAIALLGDSVESVYFVDDFEGHVKAAIRMGMRGFRLRPPNSPTGTQVPELSDLRELLAYL